jgi:hypothetical protein
MLTGGQLRKQAGDLERPGHTQPGDAFRRQAGDVTAGHLYPAGAGRKEPGE